jgi:hypothetical protein
MSDRSSRVKLIKVKRIMRKQKEAFLRRDFRRGASTNLEGLETWIDR